MAYLNVEPYLHQAKALHAIGRNKAFALTMEMGTGKTITSIGIAGALYQFGMVILLPKP